MATNFRRDHLSLLCLIPLFLLLFFGHSIAVDILKAGQSINDTQVIVSAGNKFELGFFTDPKPSNFKYLGIWYKEIPDVVVWVANRDNPIVNSSATLKLNVDGNLILVNQTGSAFWTSNNPIVSVQDPVAQLLDSGNLVLRDSNSGSEDYAWQSFDYPFDTLLSGMKLGWDSKSGLNRKLISRKNPSELSSGELSYGVNLDGLPELVVRKGNKTIFRGGPWFGDGFARVRSERANFIYNASFEITYSYDSPNNEPWRAVLDPGGFVIHSEWNGVDRAWKKLYTFEGSGCNDYELCGNFGLCNSVLLANCDCLDGFKQKSAQNISDGCVRKDEKTCRAGEGFKKISDVKLPESTRNLVKIKVGIQNCEKECLNDCSCLAYGTLDLPNAGPTCITWFDRLLDVRRVRDPGTGDSLFVRVAASELESSTGKRTVLVVVGTISAMIFFALISCFIIRSIRRRGRVYGLISKSKRQITCFDLKEAMGEELICRWKLSAFLFLWTTVALFPRKSLAIDSIKTGESVNGSTQILVSAAQNFVLGIFNPQGSKFQYLGIWYKNIPQTVVWVANRDNPLVNSSGRLTLNGDGKITLLNETGGVLWSTPSPGTVEQPVVQLLNTGNLVLRESGSENYLWQSFDYPSDTLLPGMKLGWDTKTGMNRKLTSWKSTNDPSSGDFTYSVEMNGLPQFVVRRGPITTFRSGPWYGNGFSGSGPLRQTAIYFPKFNYNAHEAFYSYDAANDISVRLVLNAAGLFQQFYWVDDGNYWYTLYTLPGDRCDVYGFCGDFGVCTFSLTAECDCMAGFEPKSPDDWEKFRWSDGCVRRDNRTCGHGEGFKRISNVKLPDSSGYLVNVNTSIDDCEATCLNNCSCLAYGIMELPTGGYGCVTWFHKLRDVKFVLQNGQDLYVRVAASELDSTNKKLMVVISVSVASFLGFLVLVICFILGRRRKSSDERPTMWSVLSMLESEDMLLSQPKQPGFYMERMFSKTDKLPAETSTSNEVTVTLLHGLSLPSPPPPSPSPP
ncbi:G-type lectin S-receptor-like serine/threonine-protein kinase, partial [Cucurbita argyrosperma subsp. argyrosperma]